MTRRLCVRACKHTQRDDRLHREGNRNDFSAKWLTNTRSRPRRRRRRRVGWQTGLLTGLREAGADLAGANATVGTSAGALVGALLSSGRDVTGALTSLAALGQSIDPDGLAAGDEAFRSAIGQASLDAGPRQALRAIGRAAQEASTPAEDVYLGLFGTLDGTACLQASDAPRSTPTAAILPPPQVPGRRSRQSAGLLRRHGGR
jgi:hypothetical protein